MRTSTLTFAAFTLTVAILAILRGVGTDVDARTALIALLLALAAALAVGALKPSRESRAAERTPAFAGGPTPAAGAAEQPSPATTWPVSGTAHPESGHSTEEVRSDEPTRTSPGAETEAATEQLFADQPHEPAPTAQTEALTEQLSADQPHEPAPTAQTEALTEQLPTDELTDTRPDAREDR
ncbi:MAG: hypothetical protein Q4P36_05755 [Bowdeniella nasicola]|nr:hypothetical protein [Bowdeniella nasicola]